MPDPDKHPKAVTIFLMVAGRDTNTNDVTRHEITRSFRLHNWYEMHALTADLQASLDKLCRDNPALFPPEEEKTDAP